MLEELQKVFREVFADNNLQITTKTSAKDIKMWDSLTHLELIASVEKTFGIQFTFVEVMQFDCVGDMIAALERLKQ